MPVTGAIADAARGVLPITWDTLVKDEAFGDGLLQDAVDTVKEEVLGSVIEIEAEDDLPLRAIRFMGRKIALELIPAGVDLWMNQPQQESATGVNENHLFVNRAAELRALAERLTTQINREEASILALLGRPARSRNLPRPAISTPADDVLITPNPREFPRPFAEPRR